MSCRICKRSSCTESFHSLEEQVTEVNEREEALNRLSEYADEEWNDLPWAREVLDYITQLEAELEQAKAENERLLEIYVGKGVGEPWYERVGTWKDDAEKFREMWGTLQAFHNVWVSDYADPADREEDLRKELCRIAQYVEEFACVQHDWTAWTEDTFFRSRSCKNCLATESVRIKQNPESLRNYEKWKADSKRIDKFLYLGLCLNVEGFHPLSREEMDKFLDSQEFRMECEAEWNKIRNE